MWPTASRRHRGTSAYSRLPIALLLTVKLAEDADTTAVITGRFVSALYRAGGTPAKWLPKLAWRTRLTEVGRQLVRVEL